MATKLTLYQLDESIRELFENLPVDEDTGEILPEAAAQIDALHEQFEEKILSCRKGNLKILLSKARKARMSDKDTSCGIVTVPVKFRPQPLPGSFNCPPNRCLRDH